MSRHVWCSNWHQRGWKLYRARVSLYPFWHRGAAKCRCYHDLWLDFEAAGNVWYFAFLGFSVTLYQMWEVDAGAVRAAGGTPQQDRRAQHITAAPSDLTPYVPAS